MDERVSRSTHPFLWVETGKIVQCFLKLLLFFKLYYLLYNEESDSFEVKVK